MKFLKRMRQGYDNYINKSERNLIKNTGSKGTAFVRRANKLSTVAGAIGVIGATIIGAAAAMTVGAAVISAGMNTAAGAGVMIATVTAIFGTCIRAGLVITSSARDGAMMLADGATNKKLSPAKRVKKCMAGFLLATAPVTTVGAGTTYTVYKNLDYIRGVQEEISTLEETQSIKEKALKVFECKSGKKLVVAPVEKDAVKCVLRT